MVYVCSINQLLLLMSKPQFTEQPMIMLDKDIGILVSLFLGKIIWLRSIDSRYIICSH